MPIYEYECLDCGRVVEVMQRMSDPPPSECGGECARGGEGKGRLKKIMSATSIGKKLVDYGGMPMSTAAPTCGSCGMAPGSCGTDN